MPVRAIVFDLFDTLIDLPMGALPRVTVAGHEIPSTVGALHATFSERHPIDLEGFAAALRTVDREWRASHWEQGRELPTTDRFARMLDRLEVPQDPELIERLTNVHMGMLASVASTPPHHAEVLARLRERHRLGVCSNFTHAPTARTLLADAGLDRSLDTVVISQEHGLRKPRREIFEATLEALGVTPEEAIHVGDNLDADVAGASALGLRTVWITRCVKEPERVLARHQGPAPTWIVRDLAEIDGLPLR